MSWISVFGIGINTKSLETISKLTTSFTLSNSGASIAASSSSGTPDKGDEYLPNKINDTDGDTTDTGKLTGDIGGDEGGRGHIDIDIQTALASLLSEGDVCGDSTTSFINTVIGSIKVEIGTSRNVVSSVI